LICLLSFLCCCLVPSLLFFTLLPLPLSPSSHLVSLSPPSHLVSPRSLSLVELQASAQTQTHTHTHTRTHTQSKRASRLLSYRISSSSSSLLTSQPWWPFTNHPLLHPSGPS